MEQKTIIFLGLQGSGKGTQVDLLEKHLREAGAVPVFRFATGNGFRRLTEEEGYTQSLVRGTLNQGTLQPLFLSVWLWADAFVRNLTGREHLIIDGFPRTILQAQVLDEALSFYKRHTPAVVNLTLSEDEALKRLALRGRGDDTETATRKRFAWYREEGARVLEYYRLQPQYSVHDINGEQTIEKVHGDILAALSLTAQPSP